MRFREFELGKLKIIIGKDEIGNDELIKKFEGKENVILHTTKPGSPFGVIEKLNLSGADLYYAGIIVARRSQDWRDNKKDVKVDVFTGKDISKPKGYKPGSWKVKKKKTITITKESILKFENHVERK